MNKFGKISAEQLEQINPVLKELAYKTIEKSEIDFGIVSNGGKRTAEEQHALYIKGVSKCDGYINKSYHQSGNAVDFIPFINNKYTWDDINAFKKIHLTVLKSWSEMNVNGWKLDWGGDWKTFKDLPHYQLDKI